MSTRAATAAVLAYPDIEKAIREYAPLLPGWHLFPVVGKVPVRGLAWTQRASADPVERAAMAELDHDGWAVACGPSALTVIDLDRHEGGEDGVEVWSAFLRTAAIAEDRGNPRVIGATPSGGRHLYFHAAGVGNRVGVLPGVDVRSDGGYVVMAGAARSLTVLDWNFPALPPCVCNLLALDPRASYPKATAPASRDGVWKALEGACRMVAGAKRGTRNSLLNWAANGAGRRAVDAGCPIDDVEARLLLAAKACGLPFIEAARTVNSGLSSKSQA